MSLNFTPRSWSTLLVAAGLICGGHAFAQTPVSVLTQHNDNFRTGANLSETKLSVTNVNSSTFGKLFSLPVDGFTSAQPLYAPNIVIPGQGTHNIIYVATAHDSVYAFDADSGTLIWTKSLGTSVPSDVINTPNILVEVGIVSTPVIDPATQTIYVVAKTYESGKQLFRLHALDMTTGAEKLGGPILITAQSPGTGDGNDGTGHISFVPEKENQRPALTLINGVIYLAFASHEDYDPYHGWVLAYLASDLSQKAAYNVTPNGGRGGIWMSGQGLVADASDNLYLMTGNSAQGSESSAGDYGESFLKLTFSGSSLGVADYFKPGNYDNLNAYDSDLGSGGPVGIPGTTEIVGEGKEGILYVVNTNNMGGLNLSADAVVQKFAASGGLWGAPIFWNSLTTPTLYVWGNGDKLKAYSFNSGTGLFATSPSSVSSTSIVSGGDPCGALSVSSNGNTAGTGIVWAAIPLADPDHDTVQGTLCAFDAANVGTELWDSRQNAARDSYGSFAKFVAPTVANGKVYMGTDSGQVSVYGLLAHPSPPAAPTGLSAVAGNGQIALSWTASSGAASYNVYSGKNPGAESSTPIATGLTTTSYVQNGLTNGQTYYYKVAAVSTIGSSPYSSEASAAPTSATGTILSLDLTGGKGSGSPAPLSAAEIAGFVPAANWNNGGGAGGSLSLLADNLGVLTGASASWVSDGSWSLPITESPGNTRMMEGYLDTPKGSDTVTVTVTGLPASLTARGYDVYVYTDGDNGSASRTGSYTIGSTTLTATDLPQTNFSGTFTQATNSAGNYLKFVNVGGASFTLKATPGATSDGIARAPVNAIQIVAHPPLVTVKSVASGLHYTTAIANVGVQQHTDRSYHITSLSPALTGATLVQTANADKTATKSAFLTLTLGASATVYVCYDTRVKTLPAWLGDGTWTLSSEAFSSSDLAASPTKVYAKSFPAGDVVLGGNLQAPARGAGANYSVVVKAN